MPAAKGAAVQFAAGRAGQARQSGSAQCTPRRRKEKEEKCNNKSSQQSKQDKVFGFLQTTAKLN